MSAENQKRGDWAFWIAFLLCISVTATSLFQTHKRNEAEAEVQRLKVQLQNTQNELSGMDIDIINDKDANLLLVRKAYITDQKAKLLGVKVVDTMNNTESVLMVGTEARNYYAFKLPASVMKWSIFPVKIVTTKKEEYLTVMPPQ